MVHPQLEGLLPDISSWPPQDATRCHVDREPHKVPVHEAAREGVAAVRAGGRLPAVDLAQFFCESRDGGFYLVRGFGVALHEHRWRGFEAARRRVGEQQRDAGLRRTLIAFWARPMEVVT